MGVCGVLSLAYSVGPYRRLYVQGVSSSSPRIAWWSRIERLLFSDHGEELPTPSPFQDGQELLTVQPVIAAQLDL